MDFLDRLRILMKNSGDNNSSLAKKSGIPYTTIDGLFKRGWEKAQISTIQRICDYYSVSLDYMVYGAEKLSPEALLVAAKYETISPYGKAVIECVLEQEKNAVASKGIPVINAAHDSDMFARYNAKREVQEMEEAVKSE